MTRSSWASEPWWARATSIGASTFDAEPFPEGVEEMDAIRAARPGGC